MTSNVSFAGLSRDFYRDWAESHGWFQGPVGEFVVEKKKITRTNVSARDTVRWSIEESGWMAKRATQCGMLHFQIRRIV